MGTTFLSWWTCRSSCRCLWGEGLWGWDTGTIPGTGLLGAGRLSRQGRRCSLLEEDILKSSQWRHNLGPSIRWFMSRAAAGGVCLYGVPYVRHLCYALLLPSNAV